jgi:hypothetical protein
MKTATIVIASSPSAAMASATSIAKTEPLPSRERASTAWPSSSPRLLHDRETEPQATVQLTVGIIDLMKFPEDLAKLFRRDAEARVPDLDPQLVSAPPTAEQDPAFLRVLHRIREQVTNHLLEETRIAADRQQARKHAPIELTGRRKISVFGPQPLEEVVDREIDDRGADHSRLELVDVEKRVQQALSPNICHHISSTRPGGIGRDGRLAGRVDPASSRG